MLLSQAVCVQDVVIAPQIRNTQVCVFAVGSFENHQFIGQQVLNKFRCASSENSSVGKSRFCLNAERKSTNLYFTRFSTQTCLGNILCLQKKVGRIRFVSTVAELSDVDIIICICHFYGWLMLGRRGWLLFLQSPVENKPQKQKNSED